MKIFTRTRILILFTILFLTIPILSEGRPYWPPYIKKSKPMRTTRLTSLPQVINTTVPQNKASIPETCPLVSKMYEMELRAISKKEKANVEVLFKESKSNLRNVVIPIIRDFIYEFEVHSVKDGCELRILKDIADFGDVEIQHVTMNRFDVVLEEEKFTLERNNLTEQFVTEYMGKESQLIYLDLLVPKLKRNYTNPVQYVGIMFLEGENKTPVGGEWVLYKQD